MSQRLTERPKLSYSWWKKKKKNTAWQKKKKKKIPCETDGGREGGGADRSVRGCTNRAFSENESRLSDGLSGRDFSVGGCQGCPIQHVAVPTHKGIYGKMRTPPPPTPNQKGVLFLALWPRGCDRRDSRQDSVSKTGMHVLEFNRKNVFYPFYSHITSSFSHL